MLAMLLAFALAAGAPMGDAVPQIAAARWFNKPASGPRCHGTVILFFFSTSDRRSATWARALEVLRRRNDVAVIGLTADSVQAVQAFIRRYGVGFTVGAQSGSAAAFGVGQLPAVRVVGSGQGGEREVRAYDSIRGVIEALRSRPAEFDATPAGEVWCLQAMLVSDASEGTRTRVARDLFDLLGPVEFVRFAEEFLPYERNPWVRGQVEFLLGVARGERDINQDSHGPSGRYMQAYQQAPEAPEWARVREYLFHQRLERYLPSSLLRMYRWHMSDEPADLVIRRWIVRDMWQRTLDRRASRRILLELIGTEPDASIRLMATMGLSEICEIPDEEAAAILEAYAEDEYYIRHVRPMMEYIGHYLRTGDEDVETMPAPIERVPPGPDEAGPSP